jgi:hypothetical protein
MSVLAWIVAAGLACAPAIATAQSAAPEPAPPADLQGRLLADPNTANQIMEMQDDPNVQSILQDPATMRAVKNGDLEALMSDPKIRALMADPRVQGMGRNLR